MRLNAQIGDYEMDEVILDMGSKVNVLTKETWELMGKPMLRYSPIQLRLENQQRVSPMGILLDVPVDIDGVRSLADFKVIEIIDDTNAFPALLGMDWDFYNIAFINLKKKQMTFEGLLTGVKIPHNKGRHCPFSKSQLDSRTFGMTGSTRLWTH